MPRGLSFLPRRTETGGAGEESLDALYRYLIGNITYTGEGLTLEKILEPNPRDAIYAPPGEPTLAITKPKFIGRALATLPKAWKTVMKGVIPRQTEPTVQGRTIRSTLDIPKEYLDYLKRNLKAIPEESLKGIEDVASTIERSGPLASYQMGTRRISLNPFQTKRKVGGKYITRKGDVAHELAHDYTAYSPSRLPSKTRKQSTMINIIHSELIDAPNYAAYYRIDPLEGAARIMSSVVSAWPGKKAIPLKAYDKLWGGAVETSLRRFKKEWPDYYKDVLKGITEGVP